MQASELTTPEPLSIPTGTQSEVQPIIDKFFSDCRSVLLESYDAEEPNIEMVVRTIGSSADEYQPSDDRLTMLLCHGQIAALVLERRSQFNDIHYVFHQDIEPVLAKVRLVNPT